MIQYTLTNKSVTVICDGDNKTFTNDNPKYDEIVSFIQQNRLDEVKNLIYDMKIKLNKVYGDDFEVCDDIVYVDGIDLPHLLGKKLMNLAEQKLDYQPLLNFWYRLKQNPSPRAVNELFGCLERNHHPIFQDGCFLAWKGVRTDLTDFRTGRVDNTPGKIVPRMAKGEVDPMNVNSCSYGYHVGSYEYAQSFGYVLLEVKVDPVDIVAVPTDCNWQKMRTCWYESLKAISKSDGQNTDEIVGGGEEYDANICDNCGEDYMYCECDVEYCVDCGEHIYDCICDD